MKSNFLLAFLLMIGLASCSSLHAASTQSHPTATSTSEIASDKHLKKEKKQQKHLARLERRLQKWQSKLAQKGGSFSLGFVGVIVLVLGGLFILLGAAIPIVGVLFIVVGGIVALVGLLLMTILGGISVGDGEQ